MIGINGILLSTLKEVKRRGEYVVTNRSGERITREGLSHLRRKYLNRLNHSYKGRKRFSLHSLRATYATRLCERGVSTRVVQYLLGHSDPRTVLRYAAVTEKAILEACKALE